MHEMTYIPDSNAYIVEFILAYYPLFIILWIWLILICFFIYETKRKRKRKK